MNRARFLLCMVLVVAGASGWADTFRFAYTKGEKYRIVSQIQESVYVKEPFHTIRTFSTRSP